MEKEPLLAYISSRRPQPPPSVVCPLSEENKISLTLSLTPSELKDHLIFGPSSLSSDDPPQKLADALAISFSSPKSSLAPPSSSLSEPINEDPEKTQSWLNDPNYTRKKRNLHRSRTAPAMAAINDKENPTVGKPPRSSSSSIVRQACVLLVVYLTVGVVIYWWNIDDFRAIETNPVVDALYFCIVTMCTIGYGDITSNSPATKLFSILFVFVGFGFIDILLSGMVCYLLDLQERYLLKAVKDGEERDHPTSFLIDFQKGRMRIRTKVGLALGVVVLCIGIGATFMHFVERLPWLDSLYLSVMSVTTVGYGDRAFMTVTGRVFACIWLLVSTLAVARAFLYLPEARVDKRHRRMAKWVLGQDMTISQFLAADMNNNGFVGKSEYVVYKLKEMGKVYEKDILQISKRFDRLAGGRCGKITLGELLQNHH